jgi:hAT family C-terminal dimerisation region
MDTIKECKSLVTYFKHSSLNSKLGKSLKQEVETRWNSKLEMLESINDQFEEISDLLLKRDELSKIENIDSNVLQILIDFLKKFQEASNFLEGSKYPTLHMVIPWYKILMSHCKVNISDNDVLIQIKSVVGQIMTNKLKIENIHKIAVFFDPRMKQLKILEQSDVLWVKEQIKSQCANLLSKFTNDESDDSTNTVQERPHKRLRKKAKESTDFSQYYDSSSDEEEDDEVDQYMKSKAPKDKDLDVLQWWSDHKNEYPSLAILSAYYLAIPASSAPSEREFSAAGQTINEHRTNLNPETIESILILHSALQ